MSAPAFDVSVAADGYVWWYLDVLDPQTGRGMTVILLLGSVFSPRYARARRAGPADPLDFCAVNIALYGKQRRWVMTEHPRATVERSPDRLRIGGTCARREGPDLVVEFDERTAPWGGRLVGRVRVTPAHRFAVEHRLDSAGLHRWWPVAPIATARVELSHPEVRFEGHAYHDVNQGEGPLEASFRSWDWCRATGGADTEILYDAVLREGPARQFGARFSRDGAVRTIDAATPVALGHGRWGVARGLRAPPDVAVQERVALEDTPFYTRSWLTVGERDVMHESLDLDRFDRRWVQFLLPFKMRGGRG